MALSKKLRFEVFKRDGFTCQYCGGHPPEKVLEADHIDPKSRGGKDDINNLVTSCFECNRGKSANPLSQVPPTMAENIKIMKEREAQHKEYLKLVRNIDSRINEEIEMVENCFRLVYPKLIFVPKFKMSVKKFIQSIGVEETVDSMERALSKCSDHQNALKYFCGVCWSKIREKNE